MNLNELQPNEGSNKDRMRVGRGIGSGKGKTSGRGVKGQKARTGVAIKGFEGGQMPLDRRLPKMGFVSIFRKDYAELNIAKLQAAIDAKKLDVKGALDEDALVKAGLVRRKKEGVKLIGNDGLKTKVELTVTKSTAGATKAVEKAGGKVSLIPPKENKLATAKRSKKNKA